MHWLHWSAGAPLQSMPHCPEIFYRGTRGVYTAHGPRRVSLKRTLRCRLRPICCQDSCNTNLAVLTLVSSTPLLSHGCANTLSQIDTLLRQRPNLLPLNSMTHSRLVDRFVAFLSPALHRYPEEHVARRVVETL